MIFYEGDVNYEGFRVSIIGTFRNSKITVKVSAITTPDIHNYPYEHVLYEKPIRLWSHEEVFAEDVFAKYEGLIRKCEAKIPLLIDSGVIECPTV